MKLTRRGKVRAITLAALSALLVLVKDNAPFLSLKVVAEERVNAQPSSYLLRLGDHPDGLRLIGERDHRVWPLYVTADMALAGGEFHLAYLTAVSVLPGDSTLRISING